MLGSLLSLIPSAIILYYVFYLENEKCACVMDWRHNFVKYFTLIAIVSSLIMVVFNLKLNEIKPAPLLMIVVIGFLGAAIVNVYSVFTYVGELDSTKCGCAVHDMKNMHTFLYYWRYLMVVSAIVIAIILANFLKKTLTVLLSGSAKGLVESGEKHKKSKKH